MAYEIGQRVRDEHGFAGTVRYIGPVATSKDASASWVGVEWDDATRGKHDGMVTCKDGSSARYFTCAMGAGSFAKPAKLDAGIALSDALASRYVTLDAPLLAPNREFAGEPCVVNTRTSAGTDSTKTIEFYGEMQIRAHQQIDGINKVALRSAGIACAGAPGTLHKAAGHLEHLDLQANLLSSWRDVAAIAREIPTLAVVDLSSNRLRALVAADERDADALPPPPDGADTGASARVLPPPPPLLAGAFPALRALVLNRCALSSWRDVVALECALPLVEELYLAQNPNLADLDAVVAADATAGFVDKAGARRAAGFARLRVLDLSDCALGSWARQVALFARLGALRVLQLTDNRLECVELLAPQTAKTAEAAADEFATLEHVALAGNPIADWASVDALARLARLGSLRLGGAPVTRGLGASEVRVAVIARVPRLRQLNGSLVGAKERTEAEKAYVRRVMRELAQATEDGAAPGDAEHALHAAHPQYERLAALHGASVSAAAGGTGALAGDLITITLQSLAASSATCEPQQKKLPSTMSVLRIKQMCARLFQLETDLQVLFYANDKGSPPTPLDDDSATLQFFGVGDGATVSMNEIDTKVREREKLEREREQKEREQSQMAEMGQIAALSNAHHRVRA